MKKLLITSLLCFNMVFVFAQIDKNAIQNSLHLISPQELFSHVEELASEKYQGRLTGSPEYLKAASWLAQNFEDMGLQPAGDNGEWFQWFNQAYTRVKKGCSLELIKGDRAVKNYQYFDEFMPGSTSGNGEVTAEVVFVGWGISAPELNFDEYKGVDVKGKIVLMRPEAPVSTSVGKEKFSPWLTYSTHQYKMKNALDHGAIGVLYHYGPLANTNNDYYKDLILSHVGLPVVQDLFEGTGQDYTTLYKRIAKDLIPNSLDLNKTIRMHNTTVHYPDGKGNNVLAVLPGSDPELKKEVILIGGHLDHVGTCYEVCPGAQDNASGIAVMMGLAKALKTSGISFKRSIVFIGIGAEEQGLVGAKTYIANPIFSLEKTTAFINLDCVGVGPNFHASGGENFPDLFNAIWRANERFTHRKVSTSFSANLGRPRSDASIFMKAGVPSLSFSSNGGKSYYHNPKDTPATIWPETLKTLTTMLSHAVAELANRVEEEIHGPSKGHLIIAGGALRDPSVFARFVELAGGEDAKIVVIPTAGDDRSLDQAGLKRLEKSFSRYGIEKVAVLHTRDPKEADSDAFANIIDQADAVWFNGGRQWRLADSYLNTATHRAFDRLLERGGVIGGSSAGATIQGSYLFRGDTKTNTILCGDHEEGLGFLNNIAIDQHLLPRNRHFDMFDALEKYPGMLGISLDENTAIEVHGDQFTVIGQHYVAVYDGKFFSRDRGGYVRPTVGGYPYYFLKTGEKYDLAKRAIIRPTR